MSQREESKARRRADILEAAERLIREEGDVSFSMRALAKEAGVAFVTPFNLFESKAGVLTALQQTRLEAHEKNLEQIAIQACEHGIVCGEGWGYIGWDAEAGDDYGTEDRPVYDDDGNPLTQEGADPETGEHRADLGRQPGTER